MLSTDQLFFDQQRPRRFQHRRLRKIDDTLSNFGDKKESYLTFTKSNWDAESVQTGVRSLKRPPTAGRRPSTASRRVSVNEIPTLLPPIDPSGPRLVSKEPLIPEEVEVRSTLSNKKREFLEEVEGKLQSREKDKPSRYWKFNEAKFVSISVLARLSELIYSSEFEITLPESLVEDLRRSHQELTADVVVEKREWQTDCYLDYKKKNEQPFLTSLPEEPQAQAKLEAAVEKVAKKEVEKEKVKKVRMSREISKRKTASPERPQTARSILSSYSFKSDATGESATDDDGRESRMEYDVLPADLSSRLMNFRQESLVPKLRRSAAKTRLEKFQMQKKVIEKKKKPKAVNLSSGKPFDGNEERKKEDKTDDGTGGGGPIVGHTTINFSMTKTDFYDEGWVVVPSDSRDPEANTLRMWQRKLREFAIKRDEEKLVAKQQGVDGPLVVKFFNDPRMKTLRSKHQRSATFPLPVVFSKLPPGSMTGFSSQPTQEAKLIGEGLTVFVLILPDGSGYCNYLSGRQAVCLSRRTEGVKGFYTTVFDDVEGRSLLAYFTPTGKACCYYPSGAIHMLCDREGGSLYSEDGAVTRKWVWPPHKLNLSQSVSIHLNAQVSVRGTNLTNFVLRVSCRGHTYKFSVGPSIENLEESRLFDISQGTLLTDVHFVSKSAKRQLKQAVGQSDVVSKKAPSKGKTRLMSFASEDEEASDLLCEGERLTKVLTRYQEKIHTVVSDWLDHYRNAIGIQPRPQTVRNVTSRPASRLRAASSQGRHTRSLMGYGYGSGSKSLTSFSLPHGHMRSYTHPLPSGASSRAASPLMPFNVSALDQRASSPDGHKSPARAVSPQTELRVPGSPLEHVQRPLTHSGLQHKPFKTGISKPRKRLTPTTFGCPVALRNMLLKGLECMPKCKCDKRKAPFICDLEYDLFLSSHVSKEQLVVVCVLSSLVENSCPCEPMLDAIYSSLNKIRYSPCTQCSGDNFRLLKYDMSHSTHGLRAGTDPLLLQRHNAAPGMFMMYMGGNLLHADYMFNGYGTTRKDFIKQVDQCIADGRRGHRLPHDYRFTQRAGTKAQNKAAWAYPVGGVLQDLIPFTPDSHSIAQSESHSDTEELSMTADSASQVQSSLLSGSTRGTRRQRYYSEPAIPSFNKGLSSLLPSGLREH